MKSIGTKWCTLALALILTAALFYTPFPVHEDKADASPASFRFAVMGGSRGGSLAQINEAVLRQLLRRGRLDRRAARCVP